jgi:hypothetical protein
MGDSDFTVVAVTIDNALHLPTIESHARAKLKRIYEPRGLYSGKGCPGESASCSAEKKRTHTLGGQQVPHDLPDAPYSIKVTEDDSTHPAEVPTVTRKYPACSEHPARVERGPAPSSNQ